MFADSVTRTMRTIDSKVLRPEGWDAAPSLFLLHNDGADINLSAYRMDAFRRALELAPPGLAPGQILSGFARAAAAAPATWPHRVEAVVFASEAWSVATPVGDVAKRDQVHAAARDRRIHERQDRVEVRTLVCVDRHNVVRMLMYERGRESDALETSSLDGASDAARMQGGLVDGVADVLRAFVSREGSAGAP